MSTLFKCLLSILFFFVPLSLHAAALTPPAISADAAVVMDADTGDFLYEKNGTKREYPASMTKMMTCLLALEKGDPYRMLTISANAADVESTRLYGGEWIRLADLTNQMMLISDNGAATAIAEAIGGNVNHFADMMNEKAKDIGCTSTHFVNANGMPDPDHYSTAEDMAKIARAAMENKQFRTIVGTKTKRIHYIRPAYDLTCENTNELLYSYPGCTGIKTGWTRAAQGCVAAAAEKDGHRLIVVVMHSNDTESRFTEAAKLLDYGFDMIVKKEK